MYMKPATLLVIELLLFQFASSLAGASDGSNSSAGGGARAEFSANAFDWRETVPYLFAAAAMPAEQGFKAVLENSKVLRAYLANQIRADCKPEKNQCATTGDGSMLDGEVSKRIDEIVQKGIFHRHKSAIVDYSLAGQPFPFSEIVVLKSEKRQDAYLILQFAGRSYTATDVQDKYGAPYDTDIFQSFSVFKYRQDNAQYTSKAVFEVDPVDGAVLKVAISLKSRNHR